MVGSLRPLTAFPVRPGLPQAESCAEPSSVSMTCAASVSAHSHSLDAILCRSLMDRGERSEHLIR
jgi:hypothetical protein